MDGLCQCGCLKPTPIAKMTNGRKGHVAGQPTPYLKAHGLHRPCARPDEIQEGSVWRLALYNKGEVAAFALVDAEVWPLIAGRHWGLNRYGYARARQDKREVLLHRVVMGFEHGDGRIVDHINRDRLDCRRENLREVPHGANNQNCGSRPGSSRYRGVCLDKRTGRWQAVVSRVYLGQFDTEEEAARIASGYRARHLPYSEDALYA